MKNIIAFAFTLTLLGFAQKATAQDCDSIYRVVQSYLVDDEEGRLFVSDGQTYTAFLDMESAEFNTTLYGGSMYRIAASAGTKDNYVIFKISDLEGNLLFTNRDFKNAPFWDFKVTNTLPVKIETTLDRNKKVSGCAVMLIGFQK